MWRQPVLLAHSPSPLGPPPAGHSEPGLPESPEALSARAAGSLGQALRPSLSDGWEECPLLGLLGQQHQQEARPLCSVCMDSSSGCRAWGRRRGGATGEGLTRSTHSCGTPNKGEVTLLQHDPFRASRGRDPAWPAGRALPAARHRPPLAHPGCLPPERGSFPPGTPHTQLPAASSPFQPPPLLPHQPGLRGPSI